MNHPFVIGLSQVGINDIETVGGKNASLGEMLQHLSKLGIQIPNGFVVSVAAYKTFLEYNNLEGTIRHIISAIDHADIESLRRAGNQVRLLLRNGRFPATMSEQIIQAYEQLSADYDQQFTDVAVRSSATAEDLPDASFAGQQETFLNVRGPAGLMDAVRNCFASLFTDRAISYRERKNFDQFAVGISICVQKMVRSDLGSSGVAFSLDTESGFRDVVMINGAFGLGELVVQGAISPDEFIVFKPTLAKGFEAIVEKRLGVKDQMMVYGEKADERVKIIPTETGMQHKFCLSDALVLQLAEWVVAIEQYYTRIRGQWTPMDVEWAFDGLNKKLFIVQARPETVHSQKKQATLTEYRMVENTSENQKILLKGIAVGDKVGCGKVNVLYSLDKRLIEGNEFREGDVLVTDMTDPDWEPVMKKAAAIITNKGGRTCHAAIVARELGVPAVVGCGDATRILAEMEKVTVSCAEGETGVVYQGQVDFETIEHDLSTLPGTDVKIMLNVASPSMCFKFSQLPNSGVGLAREEFIINNYIQVHPLALLHHRTLHDADLSKEIEKKIYGFENEADYFIKKLSYGIAKIAAAFYPQPVIVRFSDFKSNEYYNLLGGKYFEPAEENPMIGWRGASRYYSSEYQEAFGMECKAIKNVREQMGLENVIVMVPFCRTVEELLRVQQVMKRYGLERGVNGLQCYLMAELPSNILVADEFAKHIDGFSIGTNDLTQLTLGLDRDSSLVAHLYNERNPAVKAMISSLIKSAKRNGVKVGVCGQGPSDFPDFAVFLVEEGIDSLSLTPDSVVKTIQALSKNLDKKPEAPLTTLSNSSGKSTAR